MLPRFYGEVILCLKILLLILCVNPIPPWGGGGGGGAFDARANFE